MKLISLVIPCYNEELVLPLLYEELRKLQQPFSKRGAELEFLFVDDGSQDGTLDILRQLASEDSRVRYLSFSRNFGKEAAIYAGLGEAKGD